MSAPEHASQNSNNYTKNEKREDTSTDINKNGDVYKRLYTQHLFNNISDNTSVSTSVDEKDVDGDVLEELRCVFAEKRRYAVLCIRVLPRVKLIWDSLKADGKKLLRDVFERIVQEYNKQSRISVGSGPVFNISVNVHQIVKSDDDARDVNIVKLKRELERLQRELEKSLAENVALKQELEKLKRQREELQNQLQHLQQHQSVSFKYRDAVFALLVVKACIEKHCDPGKLLDFLSKELARHRTVQISESFIESYVKQLVK